MVTKRRWRRGVHGANPVWIDGRPQRLGAGPGKKWSVLLPYILSGNGKRKSEKLQANVSAFDKGYK